ncbi:hypothetical protein FD825_02355 [Klebsiella pneumoniae]|nr:hypothetical protein [Klebsiella pneumoniae]
MNVIIYGFGSFFKSSGDFNDVDLLIIHDSNSYKSCLEAISLKSEMLLRISNAHVTMLSKSEEDKFNFIEKSFAVQLDEYSGIEKEIIVSELIKIMQSIRNY